MILPEIQVRQQGCCWGLCQPETGPLLEGWGSTAGAPPGACNSHKARVGSARKPCCAGVGQLLCASLLPRARPAGHDQGRGAGRPHARHEADSQLVGLHHDGCAVLMSVHWLFERCQQAVRRSCFDGLTDEILAAVCMHHVAARIQVRRTFPRACKCQTRQSEQRRPPHCLPCPAELPCITAQPTPWPHTPVQPSTWR